MKIMIVSNNRRLKEAIVKVLCALEEDGTLKDNIQVIQSSHEDALENFFVKRPEKVVICEYEEQGTETEEYNIGRNTYKDIKDSASKKTAVVRMGFSSYSYKDYIKIPFQLLKLFERLQ